MADADAPDSPAGTNEKDPGGPMDARLRFCPAAMP